MYKRCFMLGVAACGFVLYSLTTVLGASGQQVALLAPKSGQKVSGRQVEIAVGYNLGSISATRVKAYVDGKDVASKAPDPPGSRGVVSLMWNTGGFADAQHKVTVKVYASDEIAGSAECSVIVDNRGLDMSVPSIKFSDVKTAKDELIVEARDDSGQDPIVSILVDESIKGIKNHAPYSWGWASMALPPGKHILDAYATDNAGNRADAVSVEIVIENGLVVSAAPVQASRTPAKPVEVKMSAKAELLKNNKVTSVDPVAGLNMAPPALKSQTPIAAGKTQTRPVQTPTVDKSPALPPSRSTFELPMIGGSLPRRVMPSKPGNRAEAPTAIAQPASEGTTTSQPAQKVVKATPSAQSISKVPTPPKKQAGPAAIVSSSAGQKPTEAKPIVVASAAIPKLPVVSSSVPASAPSTAPALPPPVLSRAPSLDKSQPSIVYAMVWHADPENVTVAPGYASEDAPPVQPLPTVNVTVVAPALTVEKKTATAKPSTHPAATPKTGVKKPQPVASSVAHRPLFNTVPSDKRKPISLRRAAAKAGLKLVWQLEGEIIRLSGKREIELQVGSDEALVNGHVVILPEAISELNGLVTVPASLIPNLLKLQLE